ncbi:hypothetical protein AM500_08350 [Bacillus sp. FJAT-18017]|uniref:hypothetical protein n=1 Tax=Bacillus sp. FJAT-18017 TaxID=1705566 RepID=UPI0006ADF915|nr:hypothetical protein [Bacillus sp. FJAT-18017]ALC89781.1 hypothetical protein AM500_08350 [Bacillus sp. FJAT-18017]
MKSERGYALLLVMIIATLTMIFALSLSGLALSTRAQLNKTDDINKATDIAEMGVTYYQKIVEKLVNSAKGTAASKTQQYFTGSNPSQQQRDYYLDQTFKSDLTSLLQTNNAQVNVDTPSNNFKITFKSLVPNPEKPNELIVKFESTGQTNNEKRPITGFFTIKKSTTNSRVGELKPVPSHYKIIENYPVELLNKPPKFKTNNNSTYFKEKVTIQGNRILTVNGEAYFKDLELQGSAAIQINGDAIFEKEITVIGNAYKICITGKTYLLDSTKAKLTSYPIPRNTCTKPDTSEWFFNPNEGIKVTY